MKKQRETKMDKFIFLKKKWEKSNLPPVFYHTTFVGNVPLILQYQRIIANKGKSICKEKNVSVSLSGRITKGIMEVQVILENMMKYSFLRTSGLWLKSLNSI